MRRLILLAISLLCASICLGQATFGTQLDKIEGIWIESSFKSYFDSIPSMMEYGRSLGYAQRDISIYPIGLRIQSNEQEQGVLNIGYGVLHSHFLHPEVSKNCIQHGDTIYEQGSFSIELNQLDSSGCYRIPDLMDLYALGSPCFMKIHYHGDTTITITRKATEQIDEIVIEYKRIASSFSQSYPYPNPKDYYVRSKTLVGPYVLKDSTGKVIASDFTISPSGIFNDSLLWNNRKIEFVTDVFCGGPAFFDKVIIYNPKNIKSSDVELFIYKKNAEGVIQLFSNNVVNRTLVSDKPIYTLIKKK